MESIEETMQAAANEAREICASYGLHGNVFYYAPSPLSESGRNRLYMVAGYSPAFDGEMKGMSETPTDIYRRNMRTQRLFYPASFALDLFTEKDRLKTIEMLVEYCRKAEFIRAIYKENQLEPPVCIRESEISQLLYFYDTCKSVMVPEEVRSQARSALKKFFQGEHRTGFRHRWLDYFRSDHFPDDVNSFVKIRDYFRRNTGLMSLDQLMEANTEISRFDMQEFEYRAFAKIMAEKHPDVPYAISKKDIVNHGLKKNETEQDSPIGGRMVTFEEYAVTRRDRFANESFACLEDMRPSYWEFRSVYYHSIDAPDVAAVYNQISLEYARPNTLQDLLSHDAVSQRDFPATDFMNFVSLAKANHLRFFIDTGIYDVPSIDHIHVIYNNNQNEDIMGIISRMMHDKVQNSHFIEPSAPQPSLKQRINCIQQIPKAEKPDLSLNLGGEER